MKLYKHEPIKIIRIQIKRQIETALYINVTDTSIDELVNFIKQLVKNDKTVDPFISGSITSINIRESVSGINGKSKSISFKGLTAKQTHDLIINAINNKQ